MEDHFLSVQTWQGNVLVSTSLLPQSSEEKERIYPDCRRSINASRTADSGSTHALRMPISLPPVPNFWKHTRRGPVVPVVDHSHNSNVSAEPWTPSAAQSSAIPVDSCDHAAIYTSPTNSDSATIPEDHSSLFSSCTSTTCSPVYTPSVDEDAATATSFGMVSKEPWGPPMWPQIDWQPQLLPNNVQSLPFASRGDKEQPLKRRKLSSDLIPT